MGCRPLGFVRDRTPAYYRWRQETSHSTAADAAGLLETTPSDARRADPTLIRQAASIETRFAELERKLDELDGLHGERLTAGQISFGDEGPLEARIEVLTQQITETLMQVKDRIRRDGSPVGVTGLQLQMAQNLQRGHAARLRQLTLRFRDMQSKYVQRLRAVRAHVPADEEGGDEALEGFDTLFTPEQQAQVMEHDLMIRQRNQEIQSLLRSMQQVGELFADLSTLIIEQGTILDRIDNLIEAAVEEVQAGNRELTEAEEHQKKGGRCYYIYIILMIVALVIVGVVILVRKKKKKAS